MNVSSRLPYITGLDGIRALAVLAVLSYHANFSWALGGFLGVETFFVLSGYLITSLLLAEWQASGRIDLGNFWLRRARRLLPAVWLLLLILPFLAILLAHDTLARLEEDIPAALFYITNWVYVFREVPYFEAFGRPPLLQQLWSLAVEEQFYLVWPILLIFLLRWVRNKRDLLLGFTAILILISSAWMALLYSPTSDPLRIYYGTDTRAAGFLIGALLAMIWTPGKALQASGRGKLELMGWSGLVTLLILYNNLNEFRNFLYRGGFLLTALASALLIVGASSPVTALSKVLENGILRWVGTRSYSIYLWHWPVFVLTRPGIDIQFPVMPVRLMQVAMTFGLAELSYRWIETPIRRQGFRASLDIWRSTFRGWPNFRKLSVGAGILSVGAFLVWHGFFPSAVSSAPNSSARRGASAAVRSLSNTAANLPDWNTTGMTKTITEPVIPGTIEPQTIQSTPVISQVHNSPRVTFIGDSIMQGTIPMMEDRLGRDVYIDAARKRRMEDVPALIEILAEEEHLGATVVIHLGSNRPFDGLIFDDVMESLLAHQVTRVMFINVHRPVGWEYYINKQFTEGIARWPQAELIDWDALAHSRQEWFIKDQTHLSYEGSEAYVSAIQAKLEEIP